MNSQDFRGIQEAYQDVYEESGDGYIGPSSLKIKNPLASDATRSAADKRKQQQAAAANQTGGPASPTGNTSYANRFAAARQQLNQSYEPDLFDYILEYLVAEGYADTNDNAIAIMSNMSEEWRESIVDEVLDEELTGERLARADAKMKSLGRKKSTRDARVSLDRVARGREGTGTDGGRKAPTKRGGGGTKGQTKTSGAGGADDDRGDGNRAARRAGTYRTPMWER